MREESLRMRSSLTVGFRKWVFVQQIMQYRVLMAFKHGHVSRCNIFTQSLFGLSEFIRSVSNLLMIRQTAKNDRSLQLPFCWLHLWPDSLHRNLPQLPERISRPENAVFELQNAPAPLMHCVGLDARKIYGAIGVDFLHFCPSTKC